jgi:hypothetical protein
MTIDELETNAQTSAITQQIIKLIRLGQRRGFEHVNLVAGTFQSVYKGLSFKIYNRWIPSSEEEQQAYIHSIAKPDELYNKKRGR